MRSINKITEKEIVAIRQRQLLPGEGLATIGGEPPRIIYPGRLNDDRGADFWEAVISTGGKTIRGDVEIHVNSAGWREHGHDRDAFYNRVILHVVMRHTGNSVTRLQNGRAVPVLALDKYIDIPAGRGPGLLSSSPGLNLPCFRIALRPDKNAIGGLLDTAGEWRFMSKTAVFRKGLGGADAGQLLYEEVMGALGYSKNKLPFLKLARLLPLRCLESVTGKDSRHVSETDWLPARQALLLGASGLLLGHGRGDTWTDELVNLWSSSPQPKAMSLSEWHLLKVRPNNSPVLRLAAMSCLLLRYREKGWLEGLTGLVREAPLCKAGCKSLEAGLIISPDNGASGWGQGPVTALGKGRAADIIINVLLPFTIAWSRSVSEPELGAKALALYNLYPGLSQTLSKSLWPRNSGWMRV